jgi:hypothetical protein
MLVCQFIINVNNNNNNNNVPDISNKGITGRHCKNTTNITRTCKQTLRGKGTKGNTGKGNS